MHDSTQVHTPTRARRRDWRSLFIEALRKSGVVKHACTAAGIERSTSYKERAQSPDFAAQWDEALEDAIDDLEAEARRRAFEGVEKPVFQGGKRVGSVREYSDTLLLAMLRAHRPQKYREHFEIRANVATAILDPTPLIRAGLAALMGQRELVSIAGPTAQE